MRRARSIVAGVLLVCTPGGVLFAAEAPDAADQRLAREEVNRGLEAARANRWEDARNSFERAAALWKKASILFNLAQAQTKTGRLVEAGETYRQVLRAPSNELDDDQRKLANNALAGLEPRIAHLRIVVRGGPKDGDIVSLDGKPLPNAVLATDLPANPGTHEIALARKGWRAPVVLISLAEGQTRAATLIPTEDPAKPTPAPSTFNDRNRSSSSSSSSITSSPFFWIGVGVVVIGGTIGAVCLAGACSSDDPPKPQQGTIGNVAFP